MDSDDKYAAGESMTLEQHLHETRRLLDRLRETVDRLTWIASHTPLAPAGALSLARDGHRRLLRDAEQFAADAKRMLVLLRS
jgi:hypothetical protein